jgi:hypothetical protein
MRTRHRILLTLALLEFPFGLGAQERPNGQHDFDFEFGRWRVHLQRLVKPLSHTTTWISYDGTSVVRQVWVGRANFGELEVDGDAKHIEGLSLRVYDAQARQWRIHWANGADGALGTAMVGGFANGRGVFYDQEDLDGRPIFVRFIFSGITATAFRFEQAFSDDAGKSWETNWIATFTKDTAPSAATAAGSTRIDARDFAFEQGTWSMQRRRLEDPFAANKWKESSGSRHIVQPVWAGRAALGELVVSPGPPATYAGSLLRTFDPTTKLWKLYWIDLATTRVSAPMTGAFTGGRGEFYGQLDLGDVTALARLVYSDISPTSFRTEQAWSLDGGATWTVYATDTFTRTSS